MTRSPAKGARTNAPSHSTPANDIAGPYTGRGNDSEWGARLADLLQRIMAADMAAIPKEYDRAAQLQYPRNTPTSWRSGYNGSPIFLAVTA